MVRINRRSLLGQWAHWAQLAVVAAVLCPADVLAGSNDKLIVHEWGTFTALQNERGEQLGGINIDDEPVPKFGPATSTVAPW